MSTGTKPSGTTHTRTYERSGRMFYGWRVVGAAFTVAIFGWGLGFYGPPIYLHAAREAQGWSLALVSAAVTVHFLFGSLVTANLARLYRLFGVGAVTKAGAISLATGVTGWATAYEPWQLIAATLLSGTGWTTMSAAAINAMVSPWFVRMRPAALTSAYNGASIAGIVFSPLWVAAIGWLGFPWAAVTIGATTIVTIWILADRFLARTPQQMGLLPDGDAPGSPSVVPTAASVHPLPGKLLWSDVRFITLTAGMALGLFAQIGLIAHLFSLLVPALGPQGAGIAIAIATAAAITGRTLVGWLMPVSADRRLVACANYALQIAGSVAFLVAAGTHVALLCLGVILFGAGIGNANSLPPLIAQVEFTWDDVARVVPLIVATSQAAYAFAPVLFGLLREAGTQSAAAGAAPGVFLAAAAFQLLAILALLSGRRSATRG